MLFVVGVLALGLAFAVKFGTVENVAGSNFQFDLFHSNSEQAAQRAHDEAVDMAALHHKIAIDNAAFASSIHEQNHFDATNNFMNMM